MEGQVEGKAQGAAGNTYGDVFRLWGRVVVALAKGIGLGFWKLLMIVTWPVRLILRPIFRPLWGPLKQLLLAGYQAALGPGGGRAARTVGPMSAKAGVVVSTARSRATSTRRYLDELTLEKAKHDLAVQADRIDWGLVRKAMTRYKWANTAALLSTWSGLAFAVWLAGLQGILTMIYAIQTGVKSGDAIVNGTGGVVGGFAVLFEVPPAMGQTFVLTYTSGLLHGAFGILISIACGIFLALFSIFIGMVVEYHVLRIAGYREMSTREHFMIDSAVDDVAASMKMTVVPRVLIDEGQRQFPTAWTHTRHVVVSRTFLNDDATEWATERQEFCAVLAHEFHHFREGDAIGMGFLQACCLPIALIIDTAEWFQMGSPIVGVLANFLVWPYRWLARYFIAPIYGRESQDMEYACDRASVDAGFGPSLRDFLQRSWRLEPPRTGWESVVCSTHPWTEYRIQAIDERLHELATKKVAKRPRASRRAPAAAAVPAAPAVAATDTLGAADASDAQLT